MFKYTLPLLFLLLISPSIAQDEEPVNNTGIEACDGVDINKWVLDPEEREKKRESNKTPIGLTPELLGEVLNDKAYTNAIKGIAVYFALTILLLLGSIVCIVLFFCFCCCCKKYGSADNGKAKMWFYISAIFLLLFTIFFIVMVVYISKANSNFGEIQCAINRVPLDLMEGVDDGNYNFIGFNNLKKMLESLKSDVSGLSDVTAQFNEIKNKNVDQLAKTALDSLPGYYNTFKDKTTRDGAGGTGAPQSVSTLTEGVNEGVLTEFTIFNDVAKKIVDASNEGAKFANSGETDNITSAIDQAIGYLTQITDPLQEQLNSFNSSLESGANYVPIGTYIALGFGLLLLLLSVFMFVILFCQFSKGECKDCSFVIKIILIVLSFIVFILMIIALVICLGTTVISSFCAFTGTLLDSTDIKATLGELGLEVTESNGATLDIFTKCVGKDSDGDISTLVGGDAGNTAGLDQVNVLLDGLTEFDHLKKNITEGPLDSIAITETVKIFNQLKSGELPDHEGAIVSLESLNKEIDCNDETFRLNSLNCTESDKGCKSLFNTGSYSAPSCADATKVDTLFSQLKNYQADEEALLNDMISKLSDSSGGTPNEKFMAAKQAFRDIISSYDSIEARIKNTIEIASGFNEGFGTIANCRIVRKEIESIESVFCFTVNTDFYMLFVFLSVSMFCLFVMNILICTTLRCVDEDSDDNEYKNDNFSGGSFENNEGDKIPI